VLYSVVTFSSNEGHRASVSYTLTPLHRKRLQRFLSALSLLSLCLGGFYYTEGESFLRRWSYFDGMALVIVPE
jgi:hypothetical protein